MGGILELPTEVMEGILHQLDTKDLKALRLAHRKLDWDVRPTLFHTLPISCLSADRLRHMKKYPRISAVVKEIQFQEMSLTGLSLSHRSEAPREHSELSHLTPLESLTSLVEEYVHWLFRHADESFRTGDTNIIAHWESTAGRNRPGYAAALSGGRRKWLPPVRTVQLWPEFEAKLTAVMSMYQAKAKLHDPQRLYGIFRTALPHLTELRRIVCLDGNPGGSGLGYPALENDRAFQDLNKEFHHLFSDSILRGWMQPEDGLRPAHGFLAFWRVLCELNSRQDDNSQPKPDIQHLEMRHDKDQFNSRGISFDMLDWQGDGLGSYMRTRSRVNGFRNLRTLILCFEIEQEPNTGWCWDPQTSTLRDAVAGATKLERLEIYLSPSATYSTCEVHLQELLPFITLPQLRSVVLEGFHFGEGTICRWLFMQPRLRHITLIRPYLHGRWESLVGRWFVEPSFKPESIELRSPWDVDIWEQEQGSDASTSKVPSRVSSDAILRYVNHGGGNSFTSRRWKSFDWNGQCEGWDDERDGNTSDYSDLSEYLPDDHPSPTDDSDGPVYDSAYDFANETESNPGFGEAESADGLCEHFEGDGDHDIASE
ncbi:hypothetical protein CLCR_01138 [Cladophialophora carrionii]|uniref:F-box domain-containing protein n=1 Tax=Cladophialophora carrionii TaxID=86049 RepID=A0A1C1CCY5_9EURO|nr:hypothetical protein CLCR_01138 [Cladophialophora carrionii]